MNLSRAYSLALRPGPLGRPRADADPGDAGRAREGHPRASSPRTTWRSSATFCPRRAATTRRERTRAPGSAQARPRRAKRRAPPPPPARRRGGGAHRRRVRSGEARIASVERDTRRLPPPLLYDLTELQRHVNRLFGMSAQRTLDVAQALYERHKLLSYPRTDSRHLSPTSAKTLGRGGPGHRGALPGPRSRRAPGERPLGRRFVDDAKVTDHHAIIPTATPAGEGLARDERQRLRPGLPPPARGVARRPRLRGHHGGHRVSPPRRAARPRSIASRARARRSSRSAGRCSTSAAERSRRSRPRAAERRRGRPPRATLPRRLAAGQRARVLDVEGGAEADPASAALHRGRRCSPRWRRPGRTLEEKELSDAMKDSGLGTPATRAAIIETLLKREYVVRAGQGAGGDGEGHRARRRGAPGREEPGDDRRVGGEAEAGPAGGVRARQRSWRGSSGTWRTWWEGEGGGVRATPSHSPPAQPDTATAGSGAGEPRSLPAHPSPPPP